MTQLDGVIVPLSKFDIHIQFQRRRRVDQQAAVTGAEEDERRRRLLEWTDRKGRTPLVVAAQKGHINCVLELLRLGANVHHISNRDFGGSALHEAVYYKWRSNGIVEALLRHGANPFLRNAHDRTVLHLALIENAAKDLYLPWLCAFDRYGFFAEELMVRTQFLHAEPSWMSRWVTVIPLYTTTQPDQIQCLKKTMVIYDGYHTRTPVTYMDLTGAQAQLTSDRLNLILGETHPQPIGVASSKLGNSAWSISFSATFHSGVERLNRLARAVNENVRTLIEQPPQSALTDTLSENPMSGCVDLTEDVSSQVPTVDSSLDPSMGRGVTANPSLPEGESAIASADLLHQVHSAAIAVYNGASQNDINEGICVVCLDRPQTAGFLHEDSIHRCVCDSCAYLVYLSDQNRCPICRRKIDRIITGLS